nr:poly-beta-hydroxybutyrate polymerase N-terminal domain-containing protein [Stenotrophomonas maltophilia]
MDALARAVQAAASASISPQSLLLAWTDWLRIWPPRRASSPS